MRFHAEVVVIIRSRVILLRDSLSQFFLQKCCMCVPQNPCWDFAPGPHWGFPRSKLPLLDPLYASGDWAIQTTTTVAVYSRLVVTVVTLSR